MGRGKRGRVRARCWVVREPDLGSYFVGLADAGRSYAFTTQREGAREFEWLGLARGYAELVGGQVYRRGRREEG